MKNTQIKIINNNNILKIWYRNVAPAGIIIVQPICFGIDTDHGSCTLQLVDFKWKFDFSCVY